MSFRTLEQDPMMRGTILAMGEFLFPEGAPSLPSFAEETGVATSTFRRAAQWLLRTIGKLLAERRPGPRVPDEPLQSGREEAVKKLTDLYAWLRGSCSETAHNRCYSPEAKQRLAQLVTEIQTSGALTLKEIAAVLEMNERQLRRIRKEVEASGGAPPEPKSRRPQKTADLHPEIQRLIQDVAASGDSRHPYGALDVKRILEKNYREQLRKYHGGESIARSTVARYMDEPPRRHDQDRPRGGYCYPEPFQQVAIDTSYFKIFGVTFYFITVFEMGGRLNLVTRVFLRESMKAVLDVLEECLAKYPGIGVAVIDRGTPYLNDEVRRLLEERGTLRIVCPAATPTAKAACERHFRTLKDALRRALPAVFTDDPQWAPEMMAKLLEMGIAVFREMYHRIPQDGIDGKSPAERSEAFDPARAAQQMIDLFHRSIESEPAEEVAREIHARFQLHGSENNTVNRLKRYGARALRLLIVECAYLEQSRPAWVHDLLGLLAVKARDIHRRESKRYLEQRYREEQQKAQRESWAEQDSKKEEHRKEAEQHHPERFVDHTLQLVVQYCRLGIAGGTRIHLRELESLLRSLASKLGRAFASEIARLKSRIQSFTSRLDVKERVEGWLDTIAHGSPLNL